MNKTTTLTGIYGIAALVGGVMGYLLAGSLISLWAGFLSGVALIIAALGILNQYRWGHQLGAAVSLALALFFTFRFIVHRTWFPAGVMMIFSFIVLLVLLWQLRPKSPKS